MSNFLKVFAQKIGIDKSIAYSSGARIVQGFTGVGSIFFITTFLTGVEQGFYYTFGSILALQVFFELGLTGIMTQYVAHEASHLKLDESLNYQGEDKYRSRLSSLVHFCMKWYSVLSVIVFFFLMIVGYIYFVKFGDQQASDIEWRTPWLIICLSTAIKLLQSPFTSIINGLGFVKDVSKITFYQQFIIPITTWIGLSLGMKLYASGISYLLSVIFWLYYVTKHDLFKILYNIWKIKVVEYVAYMKEIFPFQWKIALSWVSGYFVFQIFNPVLFATEGAIVAGQMGMTLHVINAIQSLSMSWTSTKIPLYSKLVALKDYIKLDSIFKKTTIQMTAISGILLLIMFLGILFLKTSQITMNGHVLAERFLGPLPLILMSLPVIANQLVFAWATYLRCHKKEPFLISSVVNGALSCLSAFVLGNAYGLYGLTIGYCVICVANIPWAYYIYSSNKKKWHESK